MQVCFSGFFWRCAAGFACAVPLGVAPRASAGVSFAFNFLDAPGVGFQAAGAVGAERRDALERAGAYLTGVLDPGHTASVVIDVFGDETDDHTLASATSNFGGGSAGLAPGFERVGDVARKIQAGDFADSDPFGADGVVNWNFEDFAWEAGSDFQPGEQDLLSTAIHELTHSLGFASGIARDGSSPDGVAAGDAAAWSPFDAHLADAQGRYLIDGNGVLDLDAWLSASTGGPGVGGLTFAGPEAVAANGGELVFLHSPVEFEDGSTASHLDGELFDGVGGNPFFLLNPSAQFATGPEIRELSAVERGILRDLGYRTTEPAAGFAAVGAVSAAAAVVPAPAALPAGLAALGALAGKRRGPWRF